MPPAAPGRAMSMSREASPSSLPNFVSQFHPQEKLEASEESDINENSDSGAQKSDPATTDSGTENESSTHSKVSDGEEDGHAGIYRMLQLVMPFPHFLHSTGKNKKSFCIVITDAGR